MIILSKDKIRNLTLIAPYYSNSQTIKLLRKKGEINSTYKVGIFLLQLLYLYKKK